MSVLGGVLASGIRDDVSVEDYHADLVADQPTLSSSIATVLCSSTPRHAWTQHPKLNPNYARTEEEKFDIGTAAHALLLQGETICEVVEAADWRTNAAKDKRDAARAAGKVPLLAKDWDRVRDMAATANEQIAVHEADPPLFAEGRPEQTLVWTEPGGVVCRARVDWLHDDYRAVDDLKTTGRSANPDAWARQTLFSIGADVQVAFYLRGLLALTGTLPTWRYVLVENQPPYALSVTSLSPAVLDLGQRKVAYAIETWRRCLETGRWPGYSPKVLEAGLPPWEETRWLERQMAL